MSSEAVTTRAERFDTLLFGVAIFSSAFLIFMVQPMVGKRILPWFGGAPAVWTVCLTFYQVMLFLGYAYAHALTRYTKPAIQFSLHSIAVVCGVALLPVLPTDSWKPDGAGDPSAAIFEMLSVNVAVPFLVLASTGPLLQAWFARRFPARSPYFLYAVSNTGSLLALLGYPFLIEPFLALSTTSRLWSIAFTATGVGLIAIALKGRHIKEAGFSDGPVDPSAPESGGDRLRVALWLLLPGCAVVLLMGITNKLCLDVASVPFLWILPLTTYLLTFIVCFGYERAYRRTPFLLVAGAILLLLNSKFPAKNLLFEIVEYCGLLFATCMVMHGELYRLRPTSRLLTTFYLCVSGGGALGGIFVGVVAPRIFDSYIELSLGIGLAWLLLLTASWHEKNASVPRFEARWRRPALAIVTLLLLFHLLNEQESDPDQLLYRERTFFGVLRVLDGGEGRNIQRRLRSGTTLHGVQFQDASARNFPTTYYGRATGIGMALGSEADSMPRSVGIVGLGCGTLAAYGRPGENFRFYEIDPAVIRFASDGGFFTFISDSAADIEIVQGDARLSLADEVAGEDPPAFDVLVIDAFSSDAIPIHLLTQEAFEIYAKSLAADGLLAVHVSNRHFHLAALSARLGSSVGMSAVGTINMQVPRYQSKTSQWIFLSRSPDRLADLEQKIERRRKKLGLPARAISLNRFGKASLAATPLWTDNYSNLLGSLK